MPKPEHTPEGLEAALEAVLQNYHRAFSSKEYDAENDDHDLVMDLFGISPELKRENRQYWGRELGMCWQLIVSRVFRLTRDDFGPAVRFGARRTLRFYLRECCCGYEVSNRLWRFRDTQEVQAVRPYATKQGVPTCVSYREGRQSPCGNRSVSRRGVGCSLRKCNF